MTSTVEPMILDVLEWVANRDRTYEDLTDAWRTSCSRLPVWEEANERGLLVTWRVNDRNLGTCHTRWPLVAAADLLSQNFKFGLSWTYLVEV